MNEKQENKTDWRDGLNIEGKEAMEKVKQCLTEIGQVLNKYDAAGAVSIVVYKAGAMHKHAAGDIPINHFTGDQLFLFEKNKILTTESLTGEDGVWHLDCSIPRGDKTNRKTTGALDALSSTQHQLALYTSVLARKVWSVIYASKETQEAAGITTDGKIDLAVLGTQKYPDCCYHQCGMTLGAYQEQREKIKSGEIKLDLFQQVVPADISIVQRTVVPQFNDEDEITWNYG